ncbi:MAG: hypothetical protein JNL72_01150 [Flavipsychrobacter sp.]|nr:hypothetical protein [Flavipsychrobacter sp.]
MRRLAYIVIIALGWAACSKPQPVKNLNGNQVAVIGHAGNGIPGLNSNLPHDSYESVIEALEINNADGVEVDVQLTADSVLFMYHDKELESLTGCSGCSFLLRAEELEQCAFKPVGTSLSGPCYLTPLQKVIERYSNRAVKPVIFIDLHVDLGCNITDVRKEWYYATTMYAINELLSRYNAYDYVFVQANSFEWLMQARDKYPDVKVFLDVAISKGNIAEAAANGFYGVACKSEHITAEEVAFAHDKGLRVQIYGERGYALRQVVDKAPDYILTDNIPLLHSILHY